MNLWDLKKGDRVLTVDGALAEVLSGTEDGQWIRVRYLDVPDDASLAGTEDLCHRDELLQKEHPRAEEGRKSGNP